MFLVWCLFTDEVHYMLETTRRSAEPFTHGLRNTLNIPELNGKVINIKGRNGDDIINSGFLLPIKHKHKAAPCLPSLAFYSVEEFLSFFCSACFPCSLSGRPCTSGIFRLIRTPHWHKPRTPPFSRDHFSCQAAENIANNTWGLVTRGIVTVTPWRRVKDASCIASIL